MLATVYSISRDTNFLLAVEFLDTLTISREMESLDDRQRRGKTVVRQHHKKGDKNGKAFRLSKKKSYDFEIYTGQENNMSRRLDNDLDISASGNVVIQLL